MKCIKCGCELNEQAKFCFNCGEAIKKIAKCPHCGCLLETNAKFCGMCGYSIKPDDKSNLEDIEDKKENQEKTKDIKQEFPNFGTDDKKAGQGATKVEEVETSSLINEKGIDKEPIVTRLDTKGKGNTKVGFRLMLLIAFCTLFIPFCTVSCGSEVVASPSGYELAGDWGFTEEQMEMLEVTIVDTANPLMIGAITFMIAAFIHAKNHTVRTTMCSGIATLLIWAVAKNMEQNVVDTAFSLKFELGYWLSLLALIGASTAFLWSPILADVVKENANLRFLDTLDFGLMILNAFIIITQTSHINFSYAP